MKKILIGAVSACLLSAPGTQAGELVFGFGWDDMFDDLGDEAIAALIEYHSEPFVSKDRVDLSFKALLQADTGGDAYVGVGVYSFIDIGRPGGYFLEAGLSVGHYHDGGTLTPGFDGTAFRSSFGFGKVMSENHRISVTLDHMMNTDFKNSAPGSETLNFRYTRVY